MQVIVRQSLILCSKLAIWISIAYVLLLAPPRASPSEWDSSFVELLIDKLSSLVTRCISCLGDSAFPLFLEMKVFTLMYASSARWIGKSICVMLLCRCSFLVSFRASFISSSEWPQLNASKFFRRYLLTWSLWRCWTRSGLRSLSYSSSDLGFSYFFE